MKKEDKLHKLIQSMSMSEKRYFNIYAQRHTIGERNNYILLFDLIEQMSQYSNEELLKKLHGHDLKTKHLASDKNYLYQLILKSLSLYHSSKSSSLKIKEWLHHIEILYEKGLYRQCLQIIKKARDLAEKYDLYSLTPEITRWECKALGNSGRFKEMHERLEKSKEELAISHNLYNFQGLYYEMLDLRKEMDIARKNESLDRLRRFVENDLLSDAEQAWSIQAKFYFWRIWAMFYYTSGDEDKELEALSQLRTLMEKEPENKQEFAMDYMVTCSRIIQLKSRDTDEAFQLEVEAFRAFPNQLKKGRKKISAQVESSVAITALSRMIEQKRFDEALAYISESESIFNKYVNLIGASRKLSYTYMLAYVHIAHEDFHQALKYVNIILNEYDPKLRPEIHSFSRILNLIIHYELGNLRLIHYAADAANRYLKKNQRLFELESYLIRWFKKLSNAHTKSRKTQMFEDCLRDVNEILSKDLNQKISSYFDISRWLESRIEGKSFQLVD